MRWHLIIATRAGAVGGGVAAVAVVPGRYLRRLGARSKRIGARLYPHLCESGN